MKRATKKKSKKSPKLQRSRKNPKLYRSFNGKEYRVLENQKLTLHIVSDDAKKAKCKDPAQCVVAQAIRRTIGSALDFVEVGPVITKIGVSNGSLMYRLNTPASLRHALIHFDEHKTWHLPEGFYTLHPVSPSCRLGVRDGRWLDREKYARNKNPLVVRRTLPTRRVSKVTSVR